MTEILPLNTSPLPVKLRVADYLTLDATGAFEAYRKTELIDGDIFYMNAQHRPHSYAKSELAYRLRRSLEALGSALYVMTESSVAMPPHDAPEPDILLTDEPCGEGLVPVTTVALIVEIADSTLSTDLGRKAKLYAAAQIAEYWVVDINARVINQLWAPAQASYGELCVIAFGEPITAVTIEGLCVDTSAL